MTRSLRALPAVALGLLATMLSGCGPSNLFRGVGNPFGYGLCGLIVIILDIVALVEIANSSRSTGDKVLWALIIIVLPFVGLIAYYFLARKR